MKKNVMSFILVIAMVFTMALGMTGCGGEDVSDWDYIVEKGTLVVGYDNAFAPMGFVDLETKKDVGFDLDLAMAVGEKLGIEIVLKPITWTTKELELKSKTIDLIWNGYTITPERENMVDFTIPYMQNQQVVVINKKNAEKYTTFESMKGAKTMAQAGSTAMGAIASNEFMKDNDLKTLDQNPLILKELQFGYVDVAVMDYVVVNYLLAQTENGIAEDLMIVEGLELASEEYGIGARKDSDTTEKINEALLELKEDGTLAEIAKKWGLEDLCLV